ncbi:MAG: DUF1080 domain-containing protein [Gemmatimonadetes bacterium]|nr:DUF1080 domain-containing protein [Gemmatimonadota bacterium]
MNSAGLLLQLIGFAGRWNLSVIEGEDRYPSWLEITDSAGSLSGRVQGRFGHATPLSRAELVGRRFRLTWSDEADRGVAPRQFEGEIDGDRITGTIHDGAKSASFTGRRAPPLLRLDTPRFGPPIDLLAGGLSGWRAREGANGWRSRSGELINTPPSSDLVSRATFSDFRLRIEVKVPPGGNSGIYLRGRYEVQVQDDHGQPAHSRRMGGIYGMVTPTAQAAGPAGEWQPFVITLIGRRVTVVLNGTTVIDNAEIPGITGGALDSDEGLPGPLMLQGDHSGVRYRNIRIEPALAPSSAAQQLAALEADRFAAQINRDTAALRNLLGDDLVYVHSNALIENKEDFIESVASGRIQYDSLVPVRMTHRVHGGTAIGTGRVRVQVRLNGVPARLELLFTNVHQRRQGRWRLVSWQSTRVP